MDLSKRAKEIIEQVHYITIATVSADGQPWNSPVSVYHDDGYIFYWPSWTQNQHSQNIRQNSRVFVVMYDSTAPEGTGQGVYMLGKAYELNTESEVKSALQYRPKSKKPRAIIEYLDDYPRRMYKFVSEKSWINGHGDINGNYIDVRLEISF